MHIFLIVFGSILLCFGLFLAFLGLGFGWGVVIVGGILVALSEYLRRNQTHHNNLYEDQIKHNQQLREIIAAQKQQLDSQAETIRSLEARLSRYEDSGGR
jgi:predicted PurR-regulated permease PerM